MGRDRLAVIVEGKVLDRSFYDRILQRNRDASRLGYQIYLAEEIKQPNGAIAGGKGAVLALHDHFRRSRRLVQYANSGSRIILCMVDVDYDRLMNSRRRSRHILYTCQMDVEAEIFRHCRIEAALSTALSVPVADAQSIASSLGDFIRNLAAVWREWIELCCIAIAVNANCKIRPASRSTVNRPDFGSVDQSLVEQARALIDAHSQVTNPEDRQLRILRKVGKLYRNNSEDLLVKGKWLPFYLESEVERLASVPVDMKHFKQNIAKNCLDTIDFGADWTAHFHAPISALISDLDVT